MKKIFPALVVLIATLGPSAFAVKSLPAPGTLGSVTLALTATYETGGFVYRFKGYPPLSLYLKTVTDTATAFKSLYSSVVKTAKYTNREFIADLITKGTLSGNASDWTLVYVDVAAQNIEGVFAINKRDTTAVYLGGYAFDGAISIQYNSGSAYAATGTQKDTRVDFEAQISTTTRSYTGYDTVSVILHPLQDETISTTALSTSSGSYVSRYDGSESRVSTQGATVFSNIIGDDAGYGGKFGVIFTGSLSFAALHKIADATVFVTAYNIANPSPPSP